MARRPRAWRPAPPRRSRIVFRYKARGTEYTITSNEEHEITDDGAFADPWHPNIWATIEYFVDEFLRDTRMRGRLRGRTCAEHEDLHAECVSGA